MTRSTRYALSLLFAAGLAVAASATTEPSRPGPAAPSRAPFERLLEPERFTGQIAELLPAGPYLYVRVTPDEGPDRWVATLKKELHPNEAVAVTAFGTREGFRSSRLDRTFAHLAFGVVAPAR